MAEIERKENLSKVAVNAAAEKYTNSPIINEIITYIGSTLGAKAPHRITVTSDHVQASWEGDLATYSFLSHGLDPLPGKCVVPDDPFENKIYPIELVAESLNSHMGHKYHVERKNWTKKDVSYLDPEIGLSTRQVNDALLEVVLRLNATRQF